MRKEKCSKVSRIRSRFEAKTECDLRKLEKEIKKSKKEKVLLSNIQIINFLKCCPNFIGCYPEDKLPSLITSFPCFLIVNIDNSSMKGSHWLAIGIFEDRIEIFDPLGFEILNWPRIPCYLLSFLHKFSQTRVIYLSKRIQSNNSVLCGYYCINYIVFRQISSWKKIQNFFDNNTSKNDSLLIKFFK